MMRSRVRSAGVLCLLALLCFVACSPGLTPDEKKYVQSEHEPGVVGYVKTLLSRYFFCFFPQQPPRPGFFGAHVDRLDRRFQPRRENPRLGKLGHEHHPLERGHGRSRPHPSRPPGSRHAGRLQPRRQEPCLGREGQGHSPVEHGDGRACGHPHGPRRLDRFPCLQPRREAAGFGKR